MGKHDFILIVETPKDEDMAAILLCTGSKGNVRTMTMKAWTETEAAKMLKSPTHSINWYRTPRSSSVDQNSHLVNWQV